MHVTRTPPWARVTGKYVHQHFTVAVSAVLHKKTFGVYLLFFPIHVLFYPFSRASERAVAFIISWIFSYLFCYILFQTFRLFPVERKLIHIVSFQILIPLPIFSLLSDKFRFFLLEVVRKAPICFAEALVLYCSRSFSNVLATAQAPFLIPD